MDTIDLSLFYARSCVSLFGGQPAPLVMIILSVLSCVLIGFQLKADNEVGSHGAPPAIRLLSFAELRVLLP